MYFRVTFAELFGRQLGCVALASILAAVSPIGALTTTTASAADYRMEKGPEAIPAGLTKEVSSQIAPSSLTVIRGTSRKICHIWLCKEWELKAFSPTGDVNYPFVPGQLMGVVQFERKHADFRDQDVEDGIYTLRYGQQPVDGAHVGTSPTRDFVLLVPAEADKSPKPMRYKDMVLASAEVSGSNHPALFSLQRLKGEGPIRHEEEKDWRIARLKGTGRVGDEKKVVSLDLVVYGQGE
jgi:hypothetical protein